MILTVTPNPAIDLTYRVPALEAGETHRVAPPAARAGGKGLNVARVIAQTGGAVFALTTASGASGLRLAGDLEANGVPSELVPVAAATRTTVAIVDDSAGTATILTETGGALSAAAEETGLPVVLQISQNCVKYHGALEPIAAATLAAAAGSSASAAVHLDHAEDEELTRRAIDLGFGSVMFDGAALAYERNVAATVRVVEHAHANEVSVEAELGEIGGKDGVHAPGVRTEPYEAQRFVAETGVDSLAVAVGSSHAMTERTARLDLGLVAALRQAVPVPLVLHGSSGAADETIEAAIRAGITKVNVSSQLNRSFTAGVRRHLAANPDTVDSRTYLREGRTAMTAEAARLMRLFDVAASAEDEGERTKETTP